MGKYYNKISYFKVFCILTTLIFAVFNIVHSQVTNRSSNYIVATEGAGMTDAKVCYESIPTPTVYWYYYTDIIPGPGSDHLLIDTGKPQESFRIQLSDLDAFTYDTGWEASTTRYFKFPSSVNLDYGTTYYWQINVTDELGRNWLDTADVQSESGYVVGRPFKTAPQCN